ncbi:unnamed protein product [Linum trigynum]|uniref:Uncharacterized protein n=1 Tax=Linum trigynum TaxID=586398 RepID=A0AAV2GE38_9ROSI
MCQGKEKTVILRVKEMNKRSFSSYGRQGNNEVNQNYEGLAHVVPLTAGEANPVDAPDAVAQEMEDNNNEVDIIEYASQNVLKAAALWK